jgi:hypothetical protein
MKLRASNLLKSPRQHINTRLFRLVILPIVLGFAIQIAHIDFFYPTHFLVTFLVFFTVCFLPFAFVSSLFIKRKSRMKKVSSWVLIIIGGLGGILLPLVFVNPFYYVSCSMFGRGFVSDIAETGISRTVCGQLTECGWVTYNDKPWEACLLVDPFEPTATTLYFNYSFNPDDPWFTLASWRYMIGNSVALTGHITPFDTSICSDNTDFIQQLCDESIHPQYLME